MHVRAPQDDSWHGRCFVTPWRQATSDHDPQNKEIRVSQGLCIFIYMDSQAIAELKLGASVFFNNACVLSCLSCVQLFLTLWTIVLQAPPSMGFSRQEDWSGWPCPPPGDLPDPGIKPESLTSPALEGWFFTTSATWETPS